MSSEFRLDPILTNVKNAKLDVVFIHGLDGDADTWRASSTEYWPQRTADANPNAQVWILTYPAKKGYWLAWGNNDQPDTRELSVLIAEKLITHKISERPCIFVCHSLGGLLVKRILLNASVPSGQKMTRFRHESVKAVMFCGTPHRGSGCANVLNALVDIKSAPAQLIRQYLGWSRDKNENHLGIKILTTTALIDELEKGNVDLQFLNEDFGGYYRHRVADGFMVKVYAETEMLKVKGVRTTLVVDLMSANPNLRIENGPAVQVLPVTGVDHSELVKPTRAGDFVVEGLNDLIRRVGKNDLTFELRDEVQQKVAMLLHAEFQRRSGLIGLHCFRRLKPGSCSDEEACFHVARKLAEMKDVVLIDEILELQNGFENINKDLNEGLTRVGCTLLIGYLAEEAACSFGGERSVLRLPVPGLGDQVHLDILVEVLLAAAREWPVRLTLDESGGNVRSASRVLSQSGQSPLSWKDDDHILHLANRIYLMAALTKPESSGNDCQAWPDDAAAKPGLVSTQEKDALLDKSQTLLRSWMKRQIGVVVSALDESSPYKGLELQKRLDAEFGEDLAVLLSSPDQAKRATLQKLNKIQMAAQQFLQESIRNRA